MSSGWRTSTLAIAVAFASMTLAACSEQLDSTAGCPTICGGQTADVENETFDAITFDQTVAAAPTLGSEAFLLLGTQGSQLDTRMIIRFDALPKYLDTLQTPITFVDSARLTIRFDSSGGRILNPVTVSIYDVTTTSGSDTSVATLAPLFTLSRLVGSKVFPAGTLMDTVIFDISNANLLGKITTNQPARFGVSMQSSGTDYVRAYSNGTSYSPGLSFKVSTDSTKPRAIVSPYSSTPTESPVAANYLADFTLVVAGSPPPPANILAIGGIPAKRAFFRFNLPSRIVDSSIVVRATLLLTQVGNTYLGSTDTISILPNLVLAGPAITDPIRASQIIAPGSYPMATSVLLPSESGVKSIEIAQAIRYWAIQDSTNLPRAIVISSTREASSPQQILIYSTSAAPGLRPQLRVSYTPRTRIGTP